jgi:fermentation-respiration switch protein FrsA (DUF1100 family)
MEFKAWITIAARILLALGAIVLFLRLFEDRLVFYPEKISVHAPPPNIPGSILEEDWLQTVDDHRLNAWLVTPLTQASPLPVTLLYLHGNAGSLFDRGDRLAFFVSQGWRVFAVDYRGYGKSAGRPSESGFYLDAAAAYDFLVQQRHIDPRSLYFYGESIGSAVAIELAGEHPCRGLILESPFTSFRDMGRAHYPLIPLIAYRVLSNQWNSLERVADLNVPIFIMHGDRDEIVPIEQGRRLFAAARSPKVFFPVAGAAHMECLLLGGGQLLERLHAFLSSPERSVSDLPK